MFNGSTGDWFKTAVEDRQGYLLSPILEGLMGDVLEDHKADVSTGGQT